MYVWRLDYSRYRDAGNGHYDSKRQTRLFVTQTMDLMAIQMELTVWHEPGHRLYSYVNIYEGTYLGEASVIHEKFKDRTPVRDASEGNEVSPADSEL